MKHLFSLMLIVLVSLSPSFVSAGSSEVGKARLPAADVATFADRVQQDLAARGAHVAIVSRVGRDPRQLPYGINYTHVSFWVYSQIKHADGRKGRGGRGHHGQVDRFIDIAQGWVGLPALDLVALRVNGVNSPGIT